MYYKDQTNKVHFLEDDSYQYLLPPGSEPITSEEAAVLLAPTPDQQNIEKLNLLALARANREIVLDRLTGHRGDSREIIFEAEDLRAEAVVLRALAVTNNDAPAVAAQDLVIAAQDAVIAAEKINLAGIKACRQSLFDMFDDQRVADAVDGEVKDVLKLIWHEIVTSLMIAAPSVVVAFKRLDEL